MSWTSEAWEKITPLYDKIINMPFNQELQKGSLPKEVFKFYMAQDAFYLGEFGKALSTISGRFADLDRVLAFSEFAAGAIVVERALHESYFKELGLPDEVEPSPSCLLYTNYIRNQAGFANIEKAVAAILPCFWIYKAVGDHIYAQQDGSENPYKNWIDTYAGEEFATSVEKAIAITDQLAEEASPAAREEMFEAFEMASKLEWMFWDSAYRTEKWPI
ncbi:thiaminase II [Echinicola vietnamensis]|uniref:Aminopyrimidine aminohydrolase n=1 Tax=Echinicola vietnamensis (strain DSM 17526 / LMG 23754 / KMM 6221) TaxID=926556 RepID=L0FV40_ECHVK|nr:thiaminase II [Echinicola vietnamensis]AGA76510.1 putative transcription activator [Echinicola vietnamensis DSM 17526]